MLRSIVLHDIPMTHVAAMERWYYRDHAPEINRRFGPWLTRHDSYLPVDTPSDARDAGYFNWRLTEGWWRELPLTGPRGNLAFSLPPVWPRVAAAFFPAQPSEDFLGGTVQPHEHPVLRWFQLLRFPDGAASADSDYLALHGEAFMRLPGVYRAFSTRVATEHPRLPGEWPPSAMPPDGSLLPVWHRLTELWFDSFDGWREFMAAATRLPRPSWSRHQHYPFLIPGTERVSTFLLERPTDEFWRDARGYL